MYGLLGYSALLSHLQGTGDPMRAFHAALLQLKARVGDVVTVAVLELCDRVRGLRG